MITYYKHQLENTVEGIESLSLAARHIKSSNFLTNWNADYVWYVLAAAEKAGCYDEISILLSDVLAASKDEREKMAIKHLKQQGIRFILDVSGKMTEIQPASDVGISWYW